MLEPSIWVVMTDGTNTRICSREDGMTTLIADFPYVEAEFRFEPTEKGFPKANSGRRDSRHEERTETPSRRFARELAAAIAIPVRMVDERLSTVEAQAGFRSVGKPQKSQRTVIDQAAAVLLLQHALDSEKRQGVAPGRLITDAGT